MWELSRQTLSKRFTLLFLNPPTPQLLWDIFPPTCLAGEAWIIGFDGKWLKRYGALLIYRDVTNHEIIWWSRVPWESVAAVTRDLERLGVLLSKVLPSGTISDWKPGIVEAMATYLQGREVKLFPQQRCLVHVEREAKRQLALHSPIEGTRILREIALQITRIKTIEQRDLWIVHLIIWHYEYGKLLTEKSFFEGNGDHKRHWHYTHKNIRAGWRLLTHNPDCLFEYLYNPLIPSTNNSLEGVNSHLDRIRGLPPSYNDALLCWKLAFSRTKNNEDKHKLWARWVRTISPPKTTTLAT